MPVATAPIGVGRAPVPARVPERARPPLRVVEPPHRRRPRTTARRTWLVSIALVVGSLLMVAAADAYLTQGQVRLTRMQQQLNAEIGRHHDLELQVARLSNPSSIVAEAQKDGLQAPSQVTDIPVTSPTTAPAPGGAPASSPGSGVAGPGSPTPTRPSTAPSGRP
jgi:hypothetical protein